jgi:hypothetical protein
MENTMFYAGADSLYIQRVLSNGTYAFDLYRLTIKDGKANLENLATFNNN